MKRLAIVTTHPIQYNAPLFQELAKRKEIEIKVFYTWSQAANEVLDVEFMRVISWDIPLLNGYDYSFVENKAKTPGNKSFFGIVTPGLIPAIKDWKADALLVYGWNFISHFGVMRYFKKKIPVYFRGDSTALNDNGIVKNVIRKIVLTQVYRYIDKAFYVGTHNRDYFLRSGVTASSLVFAPHAVDNNRFSTLTGEQLSKLKELKLALGIENAPLVFLFVGKFIPLKNTCFLLKAFIESKFKENVHLIFVGEGELEEKLKYNSGDEQNIHFLPFQNQSMMPVIYRLGDVLVLPSFSETWGLVVNEALASGLSVIVSNKVGSAPDLVVQGKNGYVFEEGSLPSLVAAMESCVSGEIGNKVITKQILETHSIKNLSKIIAKTVQEKV